MALQLLSLPRTLGEHPETNKPVQAGVGRFGPFVVSDGVYANLRNGEDDVLTIELDRALELLAQKAAGGGRGRAAAKSVIKDLGEHPKGGPIQVLSGRYGPYVSHGKVNYTVPKEIKPEDVTLEQAVAWIAREGSQVPGEGVHEKHKGHEKSCGRQWNGRNKAGKKEHHENDCQEAGCR